MSEKDLTDLERALSSLQAAPPNFNRDALMFRAGRASVPPRRALPLALLAVGAAAFLAVGWHLRPDPAPEVRIVRVPVQVQESSPEPELAPVPRDELPALSCWRMQQHALRSGVEGLPSELASVGNDQPLAPGEGSELRAGSRNFVH